MQVTVDSRSPVEVETDLLVVPLARLPEGVPRLSGRIAALDRALGGGVSAVIQSGDFRGKKDQRLLLYPNGRLPARRLLRARFARKPQVLARLSVVATDPAGNRRLRKTLVVLAR